MRFVSLAAAAVLLGSSIHAADLPADVAGHVAKFKDTDPKVRQQAISAIGKMGEKAKPALPQLIEMLNDKTTWVVTRTLMVIAQVGPDETVIKPVSPFLAREPDFRTLVVDIYVKLGDKGVPALIEALKDEKSAEGASEALFALGPIGKPAVAELTAVSQKAKSAPVRAAATKALRAVQK